MMLQTVKDACQFDEAGINAAIDARTEQVESLELLIGHDVSQAQDFFSKTYVTTGISQLLRQGLQRLAGRNGQAAFELRQAMGGGKTHSMLALGFLAAHPDLASSLNGAITEGFTPEPATVVVVSGRNIDKDQFLWGTIAQQLGKEDEFAEFWKNGAIAPNEADWIKLIALAYLWTMSSGHRAPFDDFWKALVDTEHFWRFGRADAALGSIYRVLHLKRDHDLTMRMWKRAQDRISPRDSNGMLINPPERRS